MTCLCSCDRCTYGLKISHLSHKNYIRILTKRRPEGIGVAVGIRSDLPLVNNRHSVLIGKLNRVLKGYYMSLPVVIDHIDYRSKRSGFAASGGSGNKNQASFPVIQVDDGIRNSQTVSGWDLSCHNSEGHSYRATLSEHIESVSSNAGD